MLNILQSANLLRRAREAAGTLLKSSLAAGGWGGTRVWVIASLIGPSGDAILFESMLNGDVLVGDADDQGAQRLMYQRHRRSIRTGFSVEDANLLGDKPRANETDEPGNVVRDLTPDGTYKLVISAAGLSDDGCELVCELLALAIMAQLPALLRAAAGEIIPETEGVAT